MGTDLGLAPDGVTVILTTHQMTEAEALADHVVVIERGRAVAAGSLTDLLGTDSDADDLRGPKATDGGACRSAAPGRRR